MFPVLFAQNKQGLWKSWSIRVDDSQEIPVIETEYGQENGKKVISRRPVVKPKRGHESLFSLAISSAQSKWTHKKEREGYSESKNEKCKGVSPMLAKTFDNGKHLHFPLFLQPKIDGLRCMASWDGQKVELRSRTNVLFCSPYLQKIRDQLSLFFYTTTGRDDIGR